MEEYDRVNKELQMKGHELLRDKSINLAPVVQPNGIVDLYIILMNDNGKGKDRLVALIDDYNNDENLVVMNSDYVTFGYERVPFDEYSEKLEKLVELHDNVVTSE